MIHVVATIQLQAGRRADFLAEFHQVVPRVREEVGCLEYGPTIDADTGLDAQQRIGENAVVVIERWESIADLKAHLVANHMQSYRQRVKDLVVETKLQVFQTA